MEMGRWACKWYDWEIDESIGYFLLAIGWNEMELKKENQVRIEMGFWNQVRTGW